MIIKTLTLSPALDAEYHAKTFGTGLNRTESHNVTAGGKGINVSRAILNCAKKDGAVTEYTLKTVFPSGGATGKMLEYLLAEEGIVCETVGISESTRLNVSLIPDEGEEYEVNAPGTPVGDKLGELENIILGDIGEGDVVVIAGSCPKDVKKDYPAELCGKVKAKGAVCICDADGEVLRNIVEKSNPDLIKPNRDELERLTHKTINSKEDAARAAEELCKKGINAVITTLSGDGSVYSAKEKSIFITTEKRKVVRLKGAGDTFLGAFVYARYIKKLPEKESAEYASETAAWYVAGENMPFNTEKA